MGTITGTAIIDSVAFTLQDSTNVQWTRLELLGYLNDAQRDTCLVKPDAYVINGTVALIAGTKQTIPDDSIAFSRLVRNMGVDGATPGRVPRQVDMETMDRSNPNWHTQTPAAAVLEYVYDKDDPKHYYVSPPQPTSGFGQVDLLRFGSPAALTAEANTIVLDDIYKTPLEHYICMRAYMKQGELQNNADAAAHRADWLSLLGAKDKAEDPATRGK